VEDATQIGLDEVAEIIETGNNHIGLRLDESSEEFLKHLREADLIIAKGQGHYESLTEVQNILSKPIAYLLRAKCVVVAKDLGVTCQANIVKFVELKPTKS
jgi:uncharacterized protein with ATP-grasp and redox domains